jgi:hypothetical protein
MGGEQGESDIALLIGEELALWLAGLEDFDGGRYWHAHEDWEDLWNLHKTREAPQAEIFFVQGMIQTAALLLNHERRKERGVTNLTIKVNAKLQGWDCVWGIDVAAHLASMNAFGADVGTWALDAQAYSLHRCSREVQY